MTTYKIIPVTSLIQEGPACGTTALAMALNTLNALSGNGIRHSQASLDCLGRPNWLFNSPGLLLEIARSLGFQAKAYNHLTYGTIRHHLNNNSLILTLGRAPFLPARIELEPGNWHWQLIHGYDDALQLNREGYKPGLRSGIQRLQRKLKKARTHQSLKYTEPTNLRQQFEVEFGFSAKALIKKKQALLISDPNGWQFPIPFEDYQSTFLRPLCIGPLPTGIQAFGIVVSLSETLTPGNRLPGVMQVINQIGCFAKMLNLRQRGQPGQPQPKER